MYEGALPTGLSVLKHYTKGALAGLTQLECEHAPEHRTNSGLGWETCGICKYTAAPTLDGSPPVKTLARLVAAAELELEQPALF